MKKHIQSIKGIILGLALVLGVSYVSAAWTTAPASPPSGNVDAPINVGSTAQTKSGPFSVVGSMTISGPSGGFVFTNRDGGDTTAWQLYSAKNGGAESVARIWNGSNADVVVITKSGNVGIGTNASPATKLEVAGGPIKATGGLIIESRTSDPVGPETGRMWLRTDINP